MNEDASVALSVSSEHDPVFLEVSRPTGEEPPMECPDPDPSLSGHPIDGPPKGLLVGQPGVVGPDRQRLLVEFKGRPRRSGHVEAAVTLRNVALNLEVARPAGEEGNGVLKEDDVQVDDDWSDLEAQCLKDDLRLVVRLATEVLAAPVARLVSVAVREVADAGDWVLSGQKRTYGVVSADEEIVRDVQRLEGRV